MKVEFDIGNCFTRVKADRIVYTLIYNVLSHQVESHEYVAQRIGNNWKGIEFYDFQTKAAHDFISAGHGVNHA